MHNQITHLDVLAAIPSAAKTALTRKSNRAGLRHLAIHIGALAFISGLIMLKIPFWPVLLPVQGLLLVFLFTLQHECTHQTPFASRPLNEFIGHVCGFVLLQPFLWFRYFHLAHHRHTNDPAHDPELLGGAKPATRTAYFCHISGLPAWFYLLKTLFTNASGRANAPYLPRRTLPKVHLESRLMLAGYALALLSLVFSPLLLWLWIVPILLGQPFLRLFLLAEHGRCPNVANMLENTRTTFTNRALRALSWNMPYHIEHHTFPAVPFHQLPALHAKINTYLITTSPSYSAFTRAYIAKL